MTGTDEKGHVQFTVNVSKNGSAPGTPLTAARRIQSMFQAEQIPWTWIVHEQDCLLIDGLAIRSPLCDLALGIPAAMPGLTDRSHFQRWLAGALQKLTRHVDDVPSVYLPDRHWAGPSELLRHYGFRLVSVAPCSRRAGKSSCDVRHGLPWLMAAAKFPGAGSFLGMWDTGYQAKASLARSLRRAISQQIVIDLPPMASGGDAIWRKLQVVLKIARLAMEAKSLSCETLTAAATRLAPAEARRPLQSILRAA